MPSIKLVALILALFTVAVVPAAADQSQDGQVAAQPTPSPAGSVGAAQNASGSGERAKLAGELQSLRQGLPAKKQDLARLHRKWLAAKGRVPTEEERQEFEEKRAKGEAKFEDNPYINRNPLSNPAPARAAYYKKLDEVKSDEERIRQLERESAR